MKVMVKYSEVSVGKQFKMNNSVFIRMPHNKAKNVKSNDIVNVAKHQIVELMSKNNY